MDDGEDDAIYFLVFSQAFDVVNHPFVCAKLAVLEVSPLVVG